MAFCGGINPAALTKKAFNNDAIQKNINKLKIILLLLFNLKITKIITKIIKDIINVVIFNGKILK